MLELLCIDPQYFWTKSLHQSLHQRMHQCCSASRAETGSVPVFVLYDSAALPMLGRVFSQYLFVVYSNRALTFYLVPVVVPPFLLSCPAVHFLFLVLCSDLVLYSSRYSFSVSLMFPLVHLSLSLDSGFGTAKLLRCCPCSGNRDACAKNFREFQFAMNRVNQQPILLFRLSGRLPRAMHVLTIPNIGPGAQSTFSSVMTR